MASDGDDLTTGNAATPPSYRPDYGDGLDDASGEWTAGGGASGYSGYGGGTATGTGYGATGYGAARPELAQYPREPRSIGPGGGRREPEPESRRSRRGAGGSGRKPMPLWQELPLLLLVAFCLAVLIRTFLLQAFFIPSASMDQTLQVGDRVLVNKIVYDVRTPKRGEIIVFKGTDNWAPENPKPPAGNLFARIGHTLSDLVGLSQPGEKDFIKRVIGLPGDRVSCCDNEGRVFVNGQGIDEPYVTANSPVDTPVDHKSCRSRRFDEVVVPPGQLFVMGDHRAVSLDSRCQGTVPVENVIGRAFVIVWPSSRWDTLSVPSTFDGVPGPVAMPAGRTPVPGAARSATPASEPAGGGVPDGLAVVVGLPILASGLVGFSRIRSLISARSVRIHRRRRRTLPT